MQIDVVNLTTYSAECRLYTPDRVIKMVMPIEAYLALLSDGFFIRSGNERDSAGVLNTTATYELQK